LRGAKGAVFGSQWLKFRRRFNDKSSVGAAIFVIDFCESNIFEIYVGCFCEAVVTQKLHSMDV